MSARATQPLRCDAGSAGPARDTRRRLQLAHSPLPARRHAQCVTHLLLASPHARPHRSLHGIRILLLDVRSCGGRASKRACASAVERDKGTGEGAEDVRGLVREEGDTHDGVCAGAAGLLSHRRRRRRRLARGARRARRGWACERDRTVWCASGHAAWIQQRDLFLSHLSACAPVNALALSALRHKERREGRRHRAIMQTESASGSSVKAIC